MKVLILGGTGPTGRHLGREGRGGGPLVTALVRSTRPRRSCSFPGVAIRQGQAHFGGADVTAVVAGNDAVLSAPRAETR